MRWWARCAFRRLMPYHIRGGFNVTKETEEEYVNTLLAYIAKMARLVDKDKDYSKEEILGEIDKLIKRQNKAIKKILSKEEYEMHLATYDKLLLSVKNRIAETDF